MRSTPDVIHWLRSQPQMRRCLLCEAASIGVLASVVGEGLTVVYATCAAHREMAEATVLALRAVIEANRAACEINVQDTDTSVH
jgi:hypothetical protein